jgi:hypothetical protein
MKIRVKMRAAMYTGTGTAPGRARCAPELGPAGARYKVSAAAAG